MAKAFMYSLACLGGQMFCTDYIEENAEQLEKDGWVDSPAKLDIPKEEPKKVTAEEVETMQPDQLVAKVKELGYTVLTDVELAALVSEKVEEQLAEMAKESEKVSGEEKEGAGAAQEEPLINRFYVSPTDLTKEELVILGSEKGVKLKMTQKESTMIGLIAEALKVDDE